jgi:hypothetical protein
MYWTVRYTPAVEVFYDRMDDVRFFDQGDDAHKGTAAGTARLHF